MTKSVNYHKKKLELKLYLVLKKQVLIDELLPICQLFKSLFLKKVGKIITKYITIVMITLNYQKMRGF